MDLPSERPSLHATAARDTEKGGQEQGRGRNGGKKCGVGGGIAEMRQMGLLGRIIICV